MKSSNRLWMIVMFLILALSASVNAVGLGDAVIQFFTSGMLINAIVIFFVLFLVKLILLKEFFKETSKANDAIVYSFMALVSILFAWSIGPGLLWQNKFFGGYVTFQVIVNALIIGTVLYVLVTLLKDKLKIESKEARAGILILIIILSAALAITQIDRNKFMWEKGALKDGMEDSRLYLFGDESCKETMESSAGEWFGGGKSWNPTTWVRGKKSYDVRYCYINSKGKKGYGVLRGTNLFVFVGSFFLFLWLFYQFIGDKGKGGLPTWARIAIALFISADMANSGMPKIAFIQMAYWTILVTLYSVLKRGDSKDKHVQFGLYWAIIDQVASNFGYEFLPGTFTSKIIVGILLGYMLGGMGSRKVVSWNNFTNALDKGRKYDGGWWSRFGKGIMEELEVWGKAEERDPKWLQEMEDDAVLYKKRKGQSATKEALQDAAKAKKQQREDEEDTIKDQVVEAQKAFDEAIVNVSKAMNEFGEEKASLLEHMNIRPKLTEKRDSIQASLNTIINDLIPRKRDELDDHLMPNTDNLNPAEKEEARKNFKTTQQKLEQDLNNLLNEETERRQQLIDAEKELDNIGIGENQLIETNKTLKRKHGDINVAKEEVRSAQEKLNRIVGKRITKTGNTYNVEDLETRKIYVGRELDNGCIVPDTTRPPTDIDEATFERLVKDSHFVKSLPAKVKEKEDKQIEFELLDLELKDIKAGKRHRHPDCKGYKHYTEKSTVGISDENPAYDQDPPLRHTGPDDYYREKSEDPIDLTDDLGNAHKKPGTLPIVEWTPTNLPNQEQHKVIGPFKSLNGIGRYLYETIKSKVKKTERIQAHMRSLEVDYKAASGGSESESPPARRPPIQLPPRE